MIVNDVFNPIFRLAHYHNNDMSEERIEAIKQYISQLPKKTNKLEIYVLDLSKK